MFNKKSVILGGAVSVLFISILFAHRISQAGYPMITDLSNQVINIGMTTPVIHFKITDDKTSPWDLVVTYNSNNTALVPETDDNIILGGTDAERTVQVVPVPDRAGIATITIIVTDTDGDTNQDAFQVEVINPPR